MRTVSLGDLISPARKTKAGNRELPVLSITMGEGLVHQQEKFKKSVASRDLSNYTVVKRGQLVVGFPIDEAVLDFLDIIDEGIVSPAYGIWDMTDPDRVDLEYLRKFLRSEAAISYYKLRLRGTTARRRSLTKDAFEALPVPLPSLAEQRRIAKILEASKQSISKLKTLRAELLPTAFNLLEHAQQDRSATLDDFIEDISSGRNVADTKEPHPHNQVLRVSAVTTGVFNRDEAKPLPESYAPPENHRVTPGDVLVSRANTAELLGASAITPPGVNDMYLPDKLWRVLPKEGVDPYLLWGILNTKTVRARISQRSTGSSGSMKNISQKNFLSVPCSSITSFDAYLLAQVPKTALALLELTGKKLSLLEELHASLSARAFAGTL